MPACDRLIQRHALRRGSLTTLNSLFRGNAATPRQFTITLAIRENLGTRNSLVQFITTTMARFAQPLTITRNGAIAVIALIFCTWLAVTATTRAPGADKVAEQEKATQGHREGAAYYPTPKQWASLAIAPITDVVFRTEHLTEGKIARVIKLLAKPGDSVKAGQALFVVEAPDMVQTQNDFVTAISNLNKTRSALELARIVEQQNKTLYDSRAGALRDLQTSQASTRAAENDVRSAQTSLEVTRNRLRILGMTDDEIAKFGDTGAVSPHMTSRRVLERSASAMSAPASTSTPHRRIPAQATRLSLSAICPPSGWLPMCAKPKHQMCTSARR